MAAIFKGAKLSIVRDEMAIDPQNGRARVVVWQGAKDDIYGMLAELRLGTAPPRLQTGQEGPLHTLTATFATLNDGATETPTDKWTINTEVLEKAGFFHPTVNAAMEASANPADWRMAVEDAVKDGTLVSFPGVQGQMFLELRRGATHFEDEYLVLRRTRSVSTSYTTQMSLTASRLIYSSSQLPVPTSVLFTLPNLPANPAQSQWGWRLRTQSSEVVGTKVEQAHEWVLAAWSTLYYSVSGSAFPA